MREAARAIIIRDDKLLVMQRNNRGVAYYALIGGRLESGESPEQAVVREVHEEVGLDVVIDRLVFTEPATQRYGRQYIFLCHEPSGDPSLQANSQEATRQKVDNNYYQPVWLKWQDIEDYNLMSPALKMALVTARTKGFPQDPQELILEA